MIVGSAGTRRRSRCPRRRPCPWPRDSASGPNTNIEPALVNSRNFLTMPADRDEERVAGTPSADLNLRMKRARPSCSAMPQPTVRQFTAPEVRRERGDDRDEADDAGDAPAPRRDDRTAQQRTPRQRCQGQRRRAAGAGAIVAAGGGRRPVLMREPFPMSRRQRVDDERRRRRRRVADRSRWPRQQRPRARRVRAPVAVVNLDDRARRRGPRSPAGAHDRQADAGIDGRVEPVAARAEQHGGAADRLGVERASRTRRAAPPRRRRRGADGSRA